MPCSHRVLSLFNCDTTVNSLSLKCYLICSYRMVCHKVWVCQHNDRNKVAQDRNMHCPAAIDIKIKKVNRNTKRNDPFLCREVPLQAVIKLVAQHNHSTQSADALRRLRSSKETHAAFQKYFETGMTPSEAIRHHQEQLSARSDGIAALANGMLNPNARSVYRWHHSWRENKYGPPGNPLPKLQANKDYYQAHGKLSERSYNVNGSTQHNTPLLYCCCYIKLRLHLSTS